MCDDCVMPLIRMQLYATKILEGKKIPIYVFVSQWCFFTELIDVLIKWANDSVTHS